MNFTDHIFVKRNAFDDGRDEHRRALDEIRRHEAIREWKTGITDLAREVDAWPAWKKRSFIATRETQ